MANENNNIYIESSFFDKNLIGFEEVYTEFFHDLPDNLGDRNIVSEYFKSSSIDVSSDISVENSMFPVISGTEFTSIGYFVKKVKDTNVIISLFEYSIGDASVSGSISIDLSYFVKNDETSTSGFQDVYISDIIGDRFYDTNSVPLSLWYFGFNSAVIDNIVNYINYSGNHNPDMSPIGYLVISRDIISDYLVTNTLISGGNVNSYIDATFAGWVPGLIDACVFSCNDSEPFFYIDFPTASGRFNGVYGDVYSSACNNDYLNVDLLSCSLENLGIDNELAVISGSNDAVYADIWAGVYSTADFELDINLLTLYFDNFSILENEYMSISDGFCVDIHDEVYNVVASGTYLLIDGTVVSGTLTPIFDGFRLCYNSYDFFSSLQGPTLFTVHAENDNGDFLEQDIYITFGYFIEYKNPVKTGEGYGYSNKVGVRLSAENMLSCPLSVSDGYWFETESRKNVELSASINCVPAAEYSDISACIYPQSTAFFYDKIFRMVLNAKDFNGNEMEPFILEFKIRNDS